VADVGVFETGYEQGIERRGEQRAHKQALSDQEFQMKAEMLVGNLTNLQSKIANFEKGSPDYNDAMASLTQTAHQLRELYHPDKNPGAIARFGHILTDALHLTNPKERIKKAGAARAAGAQSDLQTAEGLASDAPLSPEEQAQVKVRGGAAERLAAFDSDMAFYDKENPHAVGPDATPEEKQAREEYRNERIEDYGEGIKPIQPK
jgi:hypothetical protein